MAVINKVNYNGTDYYFCPWPVGAIYLSTSAVNLGTTWPGTTWTQVKDKFLLGANSTYTAGSTGGEATHKLTVAEMWKHRHFPNDWFTIATHATQSTNKIAAFSKWTNGGSTTNIVTDTTGNATAATGSGTAHNNMPPYLAVYAYQRTA